MRYIYTYNLWTEDERSILRQYYYMIDRELLLDKLPGRTEKQIYNQVHYLKKKKGWAFKKP